MTRVILNYSPYWNPTCYALLFKDYISRPQHSIYFVLFLLHMSIPPRIFLTLGLAIFNVLALFRVQWRSRIQDICFHFHPNSITSFTRPPIQSTIITSTLALQLWKSLIHELIGFCYVYSSASSLKSPFYNKQRNPIKVRQVKVHLQQQQLWCGVPLPLHAFEHFELLPAIVSLHPGLSRWSPILGDEGHPRKTVRKLALHTHSSMNQLQYFPTQFSRLPVHVATRF